MAGKRKFPQYLIQEPITGLYAVFGTTGARLTYAPHATHFSTASEALLAASSYVAGQPHELVRIDA